MDNCKRKSEELEDIENKNATTCKRFKNLEKCTQTGNENIILKSVENYDSFLDDIDDDEFSFSFTYDNSVSTYLGIWEMRVFLKFNENLFLGV